jgi:hypothetical protein
LQWNPVGFADYNNDQKTDLLWRNTDTGENVIWLMDGTTIAGATALPVLDLDWFTSGDGDYNGDGKTDLLWRNGKTGESILWLIDDADITQVGVLPTPTLMFYLNPHKSLLSQAAKPKLQK